MSLFRAAIKCLKLSRFSVLRLSPMREAGLGRETPLVFLPVTVNLFLCQSRCDVNAFISRTGICCTMEKRERERNGVDIANPDMPSVFDWMEMGWKYENNFSLMFVSPTR